MAGSHTPNFMTRFLTFCQWRCEVFLLASLFNVGVISDGPAGMQVGVCIDDAGDFDLLLLLKSCVKNCGVNSTLLSCIKNFPAYFIVSVNHLLHTNLPKLLLAAAMESLAFFEYRPIFPITDIRESSDVTSFRRSRRSALNEYIEFIRGLIII